jgi:hypothetical protein
VDRFGNVELLIGNLQGTYYQISKSENNIGVGIDYNGYLGGWVFHITCYTFPDGTTFEAGYLFNLNV